MGGSTKELKPICVRLSTDKRTNKGTVVLFFNSQQLLGDTISESHHTLLNNTVNFSVILPESLAQTVYRNLNESYNKFTD